MASKPKATKSKVYDESSIKLLKFPETFRKRPTMYIGTIDHKGVAHLVREIVGNSLDEAENGHGDVIRIHVTRDNLITISDEGRGIPVGPHPTEKMDTLTLLCTTAHSGGKMGGEDSGYNTSIGLNGLGIAIVNALSESMTVYAYRNKQWNSQSFSRGLPKTPAPKAAKIPYIEDWAVPANKGTIIQFKPDSQIFGKHVLNTADMLAWLNDLAWLVPVKFEVTLETKKGCDTTVIHHPNGLSDYFQNYLETRKVEAFADTTQFIYRGTNVDVLIGWTTHDAESIESYVSAMNTVDGGTHVRGLVKALTNLFKEFYPKLAFTPESIRTGLAAVVNVRLSEPLFNSQDKSKLTSPQADALVLNALCDPKDKGSLHSWLKAHPAVRDAIVNRAVELTRITSEFHASKKLAAALQTEKRGGKSLMPLKLLASMTKNHEERELFLVEGDSALGTAANARNPYYQEALPLTGKPANIFKGDPDKALLNPRVIDMLKAIGYSPKDPEKFRVGKIMLLMDSDDDGFHITCLVLGLLQRIAPILFKQGRVYVVDAPLFLYALKDKKVYADTLSQLSTKVKQESNAAFDSNKVTRAKGWGELDASDLDAIAFNPMTRKLIKIEPIANAEDMAKLVGMLGEEITARRAMLGL
jgi:DNA gyrase subunit B